MSVLIKDMEKPKSCYAVIDGESKYCPFVNTDDDCVLQLEKGICEGTWADQYSKCPLIEAPEPCEDAVSRAEAIRICKERGHDNSAYYIEKLPSAEPEIIYCGECAKMKVDTVFNDCWCGETGKKVWINHYCGYAERRTDEDD